MNVEVRQVADPIYANARGAAWIAAAGLGEIQFSDIPQLVSFNQVYQPQAAHRAIYDERFNIFKQIYRQMKPVYSRLNTSPGG